MSFILHAASILAAHDDATSAWHGPLSPAAPLDQLGRLVLAQHRANFDLWHQEDAARSPAASDHSITEIKHAIDRLNQQRNDLVEQIDEYLIAQAGEQNASAPLNSETPGLMIDRLSILALKIFHTDEEAHRGSASEQHRQRNGQRLIILNQQRSDLGSCLDELWSEVLAGRRRFRLYRQMKMYNDPELNPVLYTRQ